MGIVEIITKSLKETIKLKRFLPFFLLYLLFSLCCIIFLLPTLQIMPSVLSFRQPTISAGIVIVNLSATFIIFIIVILTNLWFTGALIFDIQTNTGFDLGLKHSQKLYIRILGISFLVFVLNLLSTVLERISFVIRILIDWVFMFSIPAIIIKKDSFENAILRSYKIVRKNIIKTFVFYILVVLISSLILITGIFFSALIIFPLVSKIIKTISFFEINRAQLAQIASLLIDNYISLILASVILSFFFSISHVFNYTSKTKFFLKYLRKRI
ncbi:MAG: hypothetical protein QXX38_00485 [Candidatus Aenigmatarchaeota archaeon]